MELTPKELADPEYMQAYVNDQHITIGELAARLAACEKKSDEEMLRVKACEHIAEGEPGWEKFREICPSTMAVASLQDRLAQAEARVQALEQENARLREALISIATNTCCDSCREAALVAQHALEGG